MLPLKVIQYSWSHPSNRGRRLRALGTTFGWQLWKRCFGKPWTLNVFNGMKMRCHLNNTVAGTMVYSSGWPDYHEMHFVQRYLRPGDNFLDVGANIGMYTLLAASCIGEDGQIVAIEGGSAAIERYRENISLNGIEYRVDLREAAVAEQPGTVRFLQDRDQTNRIVVDSDGQLSNAAFHEVEAVTIDQLTSERSFALGKIDIEGSEPIAFRGAKESLKRANPPVWVMEFKARLLKRFDTRPEDFAAMLADFGYQLGVYDADLNELTFPNNPWETNPNVLAIHEGHVPHVVERLASHEADFASTPQAVPQKL